MNMQCKASSYYFAKENCIIRKIGNGQLRISSNCVFQPL